MSTLEYSSAISRKLDAESERDERTPTLKKQAVTNVGCWIAGELSGNQDESRESLV